MSLSKLRKAIGAVKDKTSIGLAKVGSSSTSVSDLEVAIVKATCHQECPPDERYVLEIINLTTSCSFVGCCIDTIARRLNKTKNWVVAAKALMLIHRLLSEGNPAFEQEIFFATRCGMRLLNMSDFWDASGQSNAWDYSAFVRTYSLYLDENLDFRAQHRRGHGYQVEDEGSGEGANPKATPTKEMKIGSIFSRVHHLMQLLERFLGCRPTGAAKDNRVVHAALDSIIKESFRLYFDMSEVLTELIDRFMELQVPDMVRVHEIFSRVAKQYDELHEFHAWCQAAGIARHSEYPDVEQISREKLNMMDEFIQEKSRNHVPEGPEDPGMPEPVKEGTDSPKASSQEKEIEEETENKKAEKEETREVEEPKDQEKEEEKGQVGHSLNSEGDGPPADSQEHGHQLIVATSDAAALDSATTQLEAFKVPSGGDFKSALVQPGNHQASLPGSIDALSNLDGVYHQGTTATAQPSAASSDIAATSSDTNSSVVQGSGETPALPAPPAADTTAMSSSPYAYPFSASTAVAPPVYVQLSELENHPRLLVQQQLMWQQQQQRRDGMPGQVGLAQLLQH